MTDLITEAREQAQRRSLSRATRDLLNGLCDALEKARLEITRLTAALRDARNELCLKCGRYHDEHNGACDGCRWREDEQSEGSDT